MDIARGDVVLVTLPDGAVRPHVVVQNDVGNEHGETTVVVPLTTEFGPERYPHEALVRPVDGPLSEAAVALCSQPRTVDIEADVADRLGSLGEDVMLDVDRALEYSLDLGGPLE